MVPCLSRSRDVPQIWTLLYSSHFVSTSFVTSRRKLSYTYKPLNGPSDSIRLVLLRPAHHLNSPIRCRIIDTSWSYEQGATDDGRGYTALSYTWGDTARKARIEVDGRPFHITKNLERALRHLRKPHKELRLWADSICVNQDDFEERNRQVRQMKSIYSAAKETVLFLGESTEASGSMFSAIKNSNMKVSATATKGAVLQTLINSSGLEEAGLVEMALQLLRRPYWTRIWIFQEIVVSANPWVQCGSMRIPWDVFCRALIAVLESTFKQFGAGYGNDAKRWLENMYWERQAYRDAQNHLDIAPTRMGLLDLLVTKRGSEASDPRDKIFALSGLATKPAGRDPVSITYEKSTALVYMNVVKYLLDHEGSYSVLSHAGEHQRRQQESALLQGIPSWAPDWRIPNYYRNRIVTWVPSIPSREIVATNQVCLEDEGVLACLGYKFETIHCIIDIPEEMSPSAEIIGHHSRDNHWHRLKLIESSGQSDFETRPMTVAGFFTRRHPLTHRRKLAKTKSGVMCLAPEDTAEGDVICQFIGSPLPFILRPLNLGGGKPRDFSLVSLLSAPNRHFGRLDALISAWKGKGKEMEIPRSSIISSLGKALLMAL